MTAKIPPSATTFFQDSSADIRTMPLLGGNVFAVVSGNADMMTIEDVTILSSEGRCGGNAELDNELDEPDMLALGTRIIESGRNSVTGPVFTLPPAGCVVAFVRDSRLSGLFNAAQILDEVKTEQVRAAQPQSGLLRAIRSCMPFKRG